MNPPASDPILRLATDDDAAELARLLSPLGYPLTENDIAQVWDAWVAQGNFALALERDQSLLGVVTLHRMVVLHRAKPVGRITSLAIDPAVRGQGLGRVLVRNAEDALAQMGCGMVELTSHARRQEAHAFYRHMGYEQTSFRFAKVLE